MEATGETATHEGGGGESHQFPRWRRITCGGLVVLSCILAPLSVATVWIRSQVLDTDRYVETVAPLATDPHVQQTVATRVTNRLFDLVDVSKAAEEVLPKRAQFLGDALEASLRQVAHDATLRFLQSDTFKTIWEDANRLAHAQLEKALTGGGKILSTENGHVVLDLGAVIEQVRLVLKERGIGIFDNIPIDNLGLRFELMDASSLASAQKGVSLLDTLGWMLPVLTFVLLGVALWLSPNRRRTLFRWGVGTAVACAVLGAGVAVGRAFYLDAVTSDRLNEATAAAVFDTLVRFLKQSNRFIVFFGLAVALGVWLSGSSKSALRVRSLFSGATGGLGDAAGDRGMTLGPFGDFVRAHTMVFRIAGVLAVLVGLIWWDYPTVATALWFLLALLVYLALVEVVVRAADDAHDKPPTAPTPPTPA